MRYQITLAKRNTYDHWRTLARYWDLSQNARERLEWIIFYHTVGAKNVSETARYFGISRKCLHAWLKRFDPHHIQSLEERSRRPHHLRQWQVTKTEEERAIVLRKRHLAWGKVKLQRLYYQEYNERISTWKIERVVQHHQLYPDPVEHHKSAKKRKNRKKRVRIHTLDIQGIEPGKLWHVDSIEIFWYGHKRYILTGLEDKTKLAFARVYPTHSSRYAADFLKRLVYLSNGDISIVHSDNGSEFAGEFEQGAEDLSIFQVYSRVKTPNDNPALERFNRTLQEEWLALSEVGLDDIPEANNDLTNWLIEYNSVRPHQALDYQTPLEYAHQHYFPLLPMYPASTSA